MRPRIHLAGHIHEAHGAHIHTWDPASNYLPPRVQNDVNADIWVDETGVNIEGEDERSAGFPSSDDLPPVQKTVFVNAANCPHGRLRGHVPFAGPGIQPVVVDLKDNICG